MNKDIAVFLLENEEQILRELISRKDSQEATPLVNNYIKEISKEHFPKVSIEDILLTMEDINIVCYINNLILYIEGKNRHAHTH